MKKYVSITAIEKEHTMKREQLLQKFASSQSCYRCPLCHMPLQLGANASFLCANKHCFDLSSKGYVNFLTQDKPQSANYPRVLFENRRRILKDGFYQSVSHEIQSVIGQYASDRPRVQVLDVGCGEGYYALELDRQTSATVFAMDIVKDAILLARQTPSNVQWMVANLANIPLQDRSMDMILNILTPANYGEFSRVLKENGILIKLIPGEHYLCEIRDAVQSSLRHPSYCNEPVFARLHESFELLGHQTIQYTLPVTHEQRVCFFHMTPLTAHMEIDQVNLRGLKAITIHLEMLIARKYTCAFA